ncbi:hypothetical protein ACHAPT_009377 [Fusarium lateritium]
MEYVALSYVWGQTPMLKTTRASVSTLRQHYSLERLENQLPTTIIDSIKFVPLLEERYLWIDSLCIVQDDQVSAHQQIDQMAAVYDNATLVIVAVDGKDAEAGLHGLPHSSRPRVLGPVLEISPETRFTVKADPFQSSAPWMTRGWTMQEIIFSRRKIVFFDNTVRWICRCSTYCEKIDEAPDRPRQYISDGHRTYESRIESFDSLELSLDPSLDDISDLIRVYTQRSLTYEEDALAAISSTFGVMHKTFIRGFIYGLPVSYFDEFLLWRAADCGLRCREGSHQDATCPPSWSWAGWKRKLDNWDVAGAGRSYFGLSIVIPTLTWYTRKTTGSPERLIPFQNDAYHYETRFKGEKDQLPPDWTYKFEYQQIPSCYDMDSDSDFSDDYDSHDDYSHDDSHYKDDPHDNNDNPQDDDFNNNLDGLHNKVQVTQEELPSRYYYEHESFPGKKFPYLVPLGDAEGQTNHQTNSYGRYLRKDIPVASVSKVLPILVIILHYVPLIHFRRNMI